MITGTITIKLDYSDGERSDLQDVEEALQRFVDELTHGTFSVPLLSVDDVRTTVKVHFYPEVQTRLQLEKDNDPEP